MKEKYNELHESITKWLRENGEDDVLLIRWLATLEHTDLDDTQRKWALSAVSLLQSQTEALYESLLLYTKHMEDAGGSLFLIDDSGLRDDLDKESYELFIRRTELGLAYENAVQLAEKYKEIDFPQEEIYEIFELMDGTIEAFPQFFLHLIEYDEAGEDVGSLTQSPWWPLLRQAFERVDEASKDIPVEAILKGAMQEWHPTEDVLEAYLKDDLPDIRRSMVDAHLEGCGSCREKLSDIDKRVFQNHLFTRYRTVTKKPEILMAASADTDYNWTDIESIDPHGLIIDADGLLYQDENIEVGLVELRDNRLLLVARHKGRAVQVNNLEVTFDGISESIPVFCNNNGCIAGINPGFMTRSPKFRALIRVSLSDSVVVISWM